MLKSDSLDWTLRTVACLMMDTIQVTIPIKIQSQLRRFLSDYIGTATKSIENFPHVCSETCQQKMNVSKRGEAGGVKRNEAIRGRPDQSTASSRCSSPSSQRVQGASGSVLRASDASSCSAGELSESSSVKPTSAAAGYVDPDHTQNPYSQESKPKRRKCSFTKHTASLYGDCCPWEHCLMLCVNF